MAPSQRRNRTQNTRVVRVPRAVRSVVPWQINCPPEPRPRIQIVPIKRVVQFQQATPFSQTGSTTTRFLLKALLTDAFGLTGYKSAFVHNVKVWGKYTRKSEGSGIIQLTPVTVGDRPNTISAFTSTTNEAATYARVGVAYPSDLAGPFKPDECYAQLISTNIEYFVVELSATFM